MKQQHKFGMILPIVLISYFLILLDNSVVFTSTVQIAQTFQMSNQAVAWITNMYALTFGSLLLLGGKLGDLYGRKRIFLIGLIIFGSGSLLVGLAPNGGWLITMRALQGMGSAIIAPASLALIIDNYQNDQREKAISYYGVTAGLGASLGLIIGGLVTTFISWRWGFLINVPVSLGLILLTIKFINNPPRKKHTRLDLIGTILSSIGCLALVYSIDGHNDSFISFIIAVILLTTFIIYEARVQKPLMPLKLFADRQRASAYIGRFCFAGAMISYFFLVPQALQRVYGFSPALAAVAFMPETIPQFLFGLVQSKLSERFKSATLLIWGIAFTLLGLTLSAWLGLRYGYVISVAIPMVIIGIGQGFAFGPLTSFGVAHTTPDIAGVASSLVNVFHQIGSSVVLSIILALTANYQLPIISYQHQTVIMSIIMIIPLLMAINIKLADH